MPAKPEEEETRNALASELETLLEEVVFDLEHGIPSSVIEGLERIGCRLEVLSRDDPGLRAGVSAFHAGIRAFFVDPGAADLVLRHGREIARHLRDGSK